MKEFEIKDIGIMHYIIGLEVFQDDNKKFIFQTKYVNDFLHKFGMENYTIVAIPIAHVEYLTK